MTTVDEPALKTCNFCGETKPDVGFRGLRCKPCNAKYWREYRAAKGDDYRAYYREWQRQYRHDEPTKTRATQKRGWLKTMGLTEDEYNALFERQGRCCAICKSPEPNGRGRWHIDHDHSCCGRKRACKACVRGLLCHGCNVGIGFLGDDPERVVAAATYLTNHRRAQR